MEKIIGAFEARRNFGKMLQDVIANDDNIVIERHGEPVAAIVPIDVYNQIKRSRQVLYDKMRVGAERANMSPEEADKLAEEVVSAVRSSNAV